MRDSGDEDRGSATGLGQHIGEADEARRDLRRGGNSADVQRIHSLRVGPRSPEGVVILEPASSNDVKMREHLQGGPKPRIHLTGHGSRHRHGRRDGTAHGGVVESGAHDIEGGGCTIECGRIPGPDQGGRSGDLSRSGPDTAIPEEAVDLPPGCVAGVADAR